MNNVVLLKQDPSLIGQWRNYARDLVFRRHEFSNDSFSLLLSEAWEQQIAVINLVDVLGSEVDVQRKFVRATIERLFPDISSAFLKEEPKAWNGYWQNEAFNEPGPNLHIIVRRPAQKILPGPFPRRLNGTMFPYLSCLFIFDEQMPESDQWAYRLGFSSTNFLERYPKGILTHYIFFHELGHSLQGRGLSHEVNTSIVRQYEHDAESFADECIESQAAFVEKSNPALAANIRDAIPVLHKSRYLSGFIKPSAGHLICFDPVMQSGPFLPLINFIPDLQGLSSREKRRSISYYLTNTEIRMRVKGRLLGIPIEQDSVALQTAILNKTFARLYVPPTSLKPLFDELDREVGKAQGDNPAIALPILCDIIEDSSLTTELVRHHAKLIKDAAAYFCPSLLKSSQPTLYSASDGASMKFADKSARTSPAVAGPATPEIARRRCGESAWAFLNRTAPGRT